MKDDIEVFLEAQNQNCVTEANTNPFFLKQYSLKKWALITQNVHLRYPSSVCVHPSKKIFKVKCQK